MGNAWYVSPLTAEWVEPLRAEGVTLPPELGSGVAPTPAQVDAVTALSREIVERVVWEVVPVLAETIIKEEITRLTRER